MVFQKKEYKMVSTKTQIAGFEFDNCLMNAAGVACMTTEELEEVKNSAAGTFVTKTATLEFRAGNPEPRYQDVPLGSINSMGLPNQGLDHYLNYHWSCKKRILTGPSSYLSSACLLKKLIPSWKRCKTVTLKAWQSWTILSQCPWKPQIAYDFDTTDRILSEVFAYFTKPLGIKLPPYFDIVHFDQAAAIFNKYPLKFVNCVNSIGNGLYIEDESVVIRPKNGFGGIGGEYIKPTVLPMSMLFYQRLNPEIPDCGDWGASWLVAMPLSISLWG